MSIIVTFLTILSQFPYGMTTLHACVPNTFFYMNDQVCRCDSFGQWNEPNCRTARRDQPCLPGQVIWQGCSQCICQENRRLLCSNAECSEDTATATTSPNLKSGPKLKGIGPACTPFRYYYVSCSLCQCPASGISEDALCVSEHQCPKSPESTESFLQQLYYREKISCLPNIIYLFNCLLCLCSENGYFVLEGCKNTCVTKSQALHSQRCIPNTYYKKNCNVCLCPDDGEQNEHFCTHRICNEKTQPAILRTESKKCMPHSFTKPRCLYCDCNAGNVDENSCLELNCIKLNDHNIARERCSAGEMVPVCIECFCLKNGTSVDKYCSRSCSYQRKLNILENVLRDNSRNRHLMDLNAIKMNTVLGSCEPNTIYFDQNKYCLCPENGNTNFKLCTSITEEFNILGLEKINTYIQDINQINIDFNVTCKPSTFVEFDCNTCFCSKNGTIDPKWCTYDDCEAKKRTQESHKTQKSQLPKQLSDMCIPGSISKEKCNFCICPKNGNLKDRACTRNDCSGFIESSSNDKFSCEPLAYYEVDCNICLCPRDGEKNVAKCTKNLCETNFMRTDYCAPGHLFSDECNVCVCPPNGDKKDKACTNNTCADTAAAWKQIFTLSQTLLVNQEIDDTTRHLDLCFPGEEYVVGCKLCVCPDMGLRRYASCTDMLCDDDELKSKRRADVTTKDTNTSEPSIQRRKEDCYIFNITDNSERQRCTPGSMYIIRCRQCICPYMGSIDTFCRPLPEDFYCEQAYPNYNYLPMGRRNATDTRMPQESGTFTSNFTNNGTNYGIKHYHTSYKCQKPGVVADECFVCDCEESNVLIEEHCFHSDAPKCSNVQPTFLNKKDNIVTEYN